MSNAPKKGRERKSPPLFRLEGEKRKRKRTKELEKREVLLDTNHFSPLPKNPTS